MIHAQVWSGLAADRTKVGASDDDAAHTIPPVPVDEVKPVDIGDIFVVWPPSGTAYYWGQCAGWTVRNLCTSFCDRTIFAVNRINFATSRIFILLTFRLPF